MITSIIIIVAFFAIAGLDAFLYWSALKRIRDVEEVLMRLRVDVALVEGKIQEMRGE
ncbi:MAG: hypothetical protein ACXABY_09310 [Candidatus Thorarchaeota archaeon]|jgi:hypothetical protein